MIICERYHPATGSVERISPEEIRKPWEQGDVVYWIDLQHPTDGDYEWLANTFQFHPLAIEDVRNHRQRPKVDDYDDYLYVVLRTVQYHAHTHAITSQQLSIFVSKNYLVTIHANGEKAIQAVRERWERTPCPGETVPFLFYLIADTVVDSYFPIIDRIGEVIDGLDEAILHNPNPEMLHTIFTLRKSLLNIRKVLGSMRDVFNEILRLGELGDRFTLAQTRAYFMDVYDHVLRLTDFTDTYRDMLSGSLEAYQSSLSNQLNRNMQRLTVVTTILATATVITGFYGMNLRGLYINSTAPYAGHIVLGSLLLVMLFELWLFWRKGWL